MSAGIFARIACLARVVGLRGVLASWAGVRFACAQSVIRSGGVALEDRLAGEGPVALVLHVLLELEDRKFWSWSACVYSWA